MGHHYRQNAISEFLDADEADAFLVAYALADCQRRVIVTQETSNPLMIKKIKIPEPCAALNVKYLNTMEMFRQLRETF